MLMKNKETILTFYQKDNPVFAEVFAPRTKLYPDWWRSLKESKSDTSRSLHDIVPTMKTCPGFVDLLSTAIAIPMWREIKITYDTRIRKIEIAGVNTDQELSEQAETHPSVQYGNNFSDSIHLKLKSPWLSVCNDRTEFLLLDATWHRNEFSNYTVLPGKLEFKFQHSAHVNLFIPKSKETKTFTIEPGTPICYLLPLTDKDINIEIKTVTWEEWRRLFRPWIWFRGGYTKLKKLFDKGI